VSKNFVDVPLSARAGFAILEYRQGCTFIEVSHTAVIAGQENGGECSEDILCRFDAVLLAHRTLHDAA